MIYGNHALQAEAQQKNRDLLIAGLAALGVTRAMVNYSGGGDSGDTCEAEIFPEEMMPAVQAATVMFFQVTPTYYAFSKETPSLKEKEMPLQEALQEFAMIWVELHHGGWENNDGGSGTVNINVLENTCSLEHVEYYTESTRYEYDL